MTPEPTKPLLSVLSGGNPGKVPIWLMRQAGRYLPEYRALRAAKGGFLELVNDAEAAAEVTLQPIRRFGFDGAILFSDILIVPHALGQDLRFEAGDGPRLSPPLVDASLAALDARAGAARADLPDCGESEIAASRRNDLSRLRGQPVDGRDLYGGGPGQPRPGRGAAQGLCRSRRLRGDHRRDRGDDDRLSLRPDRGRRRGGAIVRQLGRQPRRPRSSRPG